MLSLLLAILNSIIPVVGVLKGYDQLMNLVLDEAVEHLRGESSAGVWVPFFVARVKCNAVLQLPHAV